MRPQWTGCALLVIAALIGFGALLALAGTELAQQREGAETE